MKSIIRLKPPLLYKWSIVFMLIIWAIPFGGTLHLAIRLAGLPLFILGVTLAVKAKRLFRNTGTPISHNAAPLKLHTEGPYRYSRNPMYLGIAIGLTGIALITGKPLNFLFPALFFLIMELFIRYEEGKLSARFGSIYQAYKRKTRRWI